MRIINSSYWLLLLLLFGCTNSTIESNVGFTLENKDTIATTNTEVQSIKLDSIKTYTVFYDSNEVTIDNSIKEITSLLSSTYDNYQFTNSSNELEELTNEIQSKSFLNLLADDFKNEKFRLATAVNFSYLVTKGEVYQYLKLEKIYFKDNNTAISCFESLKSYKNRDIHFNPINWIWTQQENCLYLISSLNHKVTSDQMQTVKQQLIKSITDNAKYETIQFYE